MKISYLLNHTRNSIVAYLCQKNYDKVIDFYPKHMHEKRIGTEDLNVS